MKETLLHTPEGVRDIYGKECELKQKITKDIHHVLHLYSYHDIDTPTFEYFNIFNMDKGSAPSNAMYKFFDRNNNTLVLRPDITPSIARCTAKYFADEELPIRLSYVGNTFINAPQHQGKLNEITQIGCELINDDSSAADAEMIACAIDCLKAAGLKEFQIEVGTVDYFKGLMEEAGVDKETEEKLRDFIQIKNFFGLSEFLQTLDMKESIRMALSEFDLMFGGPEMLDRAAGFTENERALAAVDRMKKVYAAVSYYGYEQYLSFDLSMLNGYDYYTGIVFSGYTYGTGDAVLKGGRYNNLLSQFGKDAPSIGFAIYVDEMMMALSRQHLTDIPDLNYALVLYKIEDQKAAVSYGATLRDKGIRCELIRKSKKHELEEYIEYSKRMHIQTMYHFESETDVMIYDLVNDISKKVDISALMKEEN